MAKPDALDNFRAGDHKRRDVTLAHAIDNFVDNSAKAIGRTKSQVLKSIKNFDIAGKPCAEIDSADIVAFAQEKLKSGVTPQTVSNDMSHIRHILEGIDHVLFVACLFIGAPALRDLLWRITAFTEGHIVTLALGFLGLLLRARGSCPQSKWGSHFQSFTQQYWP